MNKQDKSDKRKHLPASSFPLLLLLGCLGLLLVACTPDIELHSVDIKESGLLPAEEEKETANGQEGLNPQEGQTAPTLPDGTDEAGGDSSTSPSGAPAQASFLGKWQETHQVIPLPGQEKGEDRETGAEKSEPKTGDPDPLTNLSPDRAWPIEKIRENMEKVIRDMGLEEADFALAFENLETGEIWGLDVDKAYNAASTIKLAAALCSYEQVAAGAGSLADMVTIMEEDLELGTGPISAAGPGSAYSVEDLIEASIMHSDNTAFLALLRYWQGRVPEGWMILTMDRRFNLHYDGTRELTPRECLGMLSELYVNPQQIPGYDQLVYYMQNTSYPAMAATYLPIPVARKYGKLNGLYHDIGIVYADQPFAFAIFTDGLALPAESIAQLSLAFYQAVTGTPAQ